MELKVGERYILEDGDDSFFVMLISDDKVQVRIRRISDNCEGICDRNRLRPYFKVRDKCTFYTKDIGELENLEVLYVYEDNYLDVNYKGLSRLNLNYVKKVTFLEAPPQECVCDRLDLFNLGCKCGQMERERAARKNRT